MPSDYMEGFHTDDDGNWIPNGFCDPDDPTQFYDDFNDSNDYLGDYNFFGDDYY